MIVRSSISKMVVVLRRNPLCFHNISLACYRRGVASSRSSSNAAASSSLIMSQAQDDLNFCKLNVRKYDPAGMLPGLLLYADQRMQMSYFAVRSFWVETGLRFTTANSSKASKNTTTTTPTNQGQQLDWWHEGIEKYVFSSADNVDFDEQQQQQFSTHPTLRLLRHLVHDHTTDKNTSAGVSNENSPSLWKKESFETILQGRRMDLNVTKQYETLDQLVQHAEQSCGNLIKLVLQSNSSLCRMAKNHQQQGSYFESLYEAARLVGICHGVTNALRTSIPVISLSGKLIIPAELTRQHGVKSPRYLLSALGQGSDDGCVRALQACVQDIVVVARRHLQQARDLRPAILQELEDDQNVTSSARRVILAALLPVVASETFLNRLEQSHYQLTDSNLRHVGLVEHATCAARMISAYYRQTY